MCFDRGRDKMRFKQCGRTGTRACHIIIVPIVEKEDESKSKSKGEPKK